MYTMFFVIISALHVSGGISAHHQELLNCMSSLGYFHDFLDGMEPNHTSGRQQESMTTPKVAHIVLYAPDDGRENRPKHVER